MIQTTILSITPRTKIEVPRITIGMAPSQAYLTFQVNNVADSVTISLPADDDSALEICDRLEAAVDNLVSYVRERQRQRDAAELGPLGAGASVEAYRG